MRFAFLGSLVVGSPLRLISKQRRGRGLEVASCECYGVIKAFYDRIMQ
jgi:hypothetical protein